MALAMLTAFCGSSFAQTAGVQKEGAQASAAPAGGQSQPAATFHVNAHLAVADVVVTDRHGMLVHGLTANDFHVFENGETQKIASFEEHTGGAGSAPTATTASLPPDTYS